MVAIRNNQARLYDLLFEGVSMLSYERGEIGAMLDEENGDVKALTEKLSAYR